MLAAPRPATRQEVPILDLTPLMSGGPIDALAREMRRACETIGFFYVANHGIGESVIDGVFAATKRYFDHPAEERMKDRMDEVFRRGFMPYGVNQQEGYPPDLKESYDFGLDLSLDDPDVKARRPLHAPNKWPSDKPWLREAAEAYFNGSMKLGTALLRPLAKSLDMPEGYFQQYLKKPMVQTRLFHYPAQAPTSADNEFGVAPHTDYGCLTLLAQDPIGGLELKKRDGEWIGAPYIPGTLVINLGDLMAVWTNDIYVSNPHRVVNRSGKERYSIPTFFNLDYDTPVACLPTCQSPERPAKYEPIKSGDYLVQRFRKVQKYKPPSAAAE